MTVHVKMVIILLDDCITIRLQKRPPQSNRLMHVKPKIIVLDDISANHLAEYPND